MSAVIVACGVCVMLQLAFV